jgi:O-antigen/teichoic acid export membrane protein
MFKKLFRRVWDSPTILTGGNMISSTIRLLILTPLILVRYNIDEIAFWYLLLTINSFATVIDFGFYPTFSRVVSYVFHGMESFDHKTGSHDAGNGKPNWELMKRIYGTINSTYLAISFLVIVLIVLFSYNSMSNVIIKTQEQTELWTAYYIYVISVFISFFSRKFDTVIIGTNNLVLITRWDIVNNFLNAMVSVFIVYFHYSLTVLAASQFFFSLLLVARAYYLERIICDKKFREFKFFTFSKDVFLWCWSPAWRSGILILCSTGINQATGLIYSNVANSVNLAAYLLSLKLVTTIAQFSQAPFYSKLPLLSGLRVKNDIEDLRQVSASSMQKALLVFVIGMGGLILFGQWGMQLIGSKASLIDYRILMVMAIVWFLERHHAMHAQIYVTTNKIPFYKSAIVTGVINISLLVILLPVIDVWAFPIAQGISNLAINNWWNVSVSIKSLQTNFKQFFLKSAFVPVCIILFIFLIKFLIQAI